jgi:hypothetical protein
MEPTILDFKFPILDQSVAPNLKSKILDPKWTDRERFELSIPLQV